MEIKPHFNNIRQVILNNLLESNSEIYIAVAWFTNHDIFNVLLEKAKKIPVNLIILNDDINNRIDGLDFQQFIDNGGKFYFGKQETPMHNKFCIIDDKTLITGSYNYTYLAEKINYENIIIFKGASDIIESYKKEFSNIISKIKPIESITDYLEQNPYQRNLFSFNNYGVRDIYQHTQQMKDDGLNEEAKVIIEQIEIESKLPTSNDFIINDVIYKQWKQDYYTDKIQVLDNHLILYFRTNTNTGCWVNGPNAKHSWIIRSSINHNIIRKAIRLTNIKVDGRRLVTSTENEEIFYLNKNEEFDNINNLGYKFNNDNKPIKENGTLVPITFFKILNDSYELTCEIHFDVNNFPLETIDLIEGLGTDEKANHWHCFDINLRLNREKL
jgi:hypothetical protein